MRVLSKTTIVGFGLVLLVLLGCSSDNQSEIKTGSLNLFYAGDAGSGLEWGIVLYKPLMVDTTNLFSIGQSKRYIYFDDLASSYQIENDSLVVQKFNEKGASVKFDSIAPGEYDVLIYTGLYQTPDTVIQGNDTLIGYRYSDYQSGYKPILISGLTIKKGSISIISIDDLLEGDPSAAFGGITLDIINSQKASVVYIKWKENYIPIKQEKVGSSNKAFG